MDWDAGALRREIDTAVERYAAVIATERVTVETEWVTAVMRLDGALRDIQLDPRAVRRLGADGLGAELTEAIRAAEQEVERRCRELAGQVTFLGHPVFDLIDEMINDPAGAVRRLTGPGHGW